MSDSEVIAGTEEIQANRVQSIFVQLQTKPITMLSLLHVLKELELLDSDFDADEFLLRLAKK
jgi:hypothetical protein